MNDADKVLLRKAKAIFDREVECKHGRPATECARCRDKKDIFNSRTRTGTTRDVIRDLVKAGFVDSVEVYDPLKNSHRRISLLKIATIAGTLFVGSALAYEAGKVVLHLIQRVRNPSSKSSS